MQQLAQQYPERFLGPLASLLYVRADVYRAQDIVRLISAQYGAPRLQHHARRLPPACRDLHPTRLASGVAAAAAGRRPAGRRAECEDAPPGCSAAALAANDLSTVLVADKEMQDIVHRTRALRSIAMIRLDHISERWATSYHMPHE
jgi:hypothetical protein